jgi:hypothetical protein
MTTDRALLRAAIEAATGGRVSPFARLLDVGVSTVFAWRAGSIPLPRDVRRTCAAILADPAHVVAAYTRAAVTGVTGD